MSHSKAIDNPIGVPHNRYMSTTAAAVFFDNDTTIFVHDSLDVTRAVFRMHLGNSIFSLDMPIEWRESFIEAMGNIRRKGLTERNTVNEPVGCYSLSASVNGKMTISQNAVTFSNDSHVFMIFPENVRVDIYVMM